MRTLGFLPGVVVLVALASCEDDSTTDPGVTPGIDAAFTSPDGPAVDSGSDSSNPADASDGSVIGAGFTAITAGASHTCGLKGAVAYCWGLNTDGQLGDTSTTNRSVPVAVSGGLGFAALTAGRQHTCGLTSAGAAYCWGFNNAGQLGTGTGDTRTPTAVTGALVFTSLTAGSYHTCGLTAAGAYCWGDNQYGTIGDTTNMGRPAPTAVSGALVFTALRAGGGHQTCGVSGGAAYCWGNNLFGQLGDGTSTLANNRMVPTAVLGGLTFASVDPGGSHTCGRLSNGQTHCWGANNYGQVGDTSTTPRTSPAMVSGGLTFTVLSGSAGVSSGHTCGLTSAGAAHCWGWNSTGQLGDGTKMQRTAPTPVLGGLAFAAVSAGYGHTCGLTTGGLAYCWGFNISGQLGIGTFAESLTPVQVK